MNENLNIVFDLDFCILGIINTMKWIAQSFSKWLRFLGYLSDFLVASTCVDIWGATAEVIKSLVAVVKDGHELDFR